MQSHEFKSCYVHYDSDTLIIGNTHIERAWSFEGDIPVSNRITDKTTGKAWLATSGVASVNLPGQGLRSGDLQIDSDNDLGFSEEALRVSLPFYHPDGMWRWIHLVYPNTAFLRSYWEFVPDNSAAGASAVADPAIASNTAVNGGKDTPTSPKPPPADTLDHFNLTPLHTFWRSVVLRDVTDHHNNLVSEDHGLLYGSEKRHLQGNLLFLQDVLDESGLLVIKESPTPLAQQNYPGHDFTLEGNRFTISGSGFGSGANACKTMDASIQSIRSYGVTVGVYQEGEVGALLAVQEYHKTIRRLTPERDFYVMSNTWGDRSRDSRVSEAFILSELPVAARLGITVYQIDDGWQKGCTSNSVQSGGTWNGFYAADPDFWQPHPERFPRGLRPISTRAKELGVRLGLWFAPDSTDDFFNWEKDADVLMNLHHEYQVTHFKLDAIKLRSKLGEERLINMMRRVIKHTAGEVTFNLDTTAEVRLGYYGRSHYGSLFLENRYTDFRSYFPHRTLRNLWMLARYFPASRLQMEFLNLRRHQEKYGDDPLAPANVGLSYVFGVTVCSNPLAWMELTGLNNGDQDELAKLIPAYRQHQEAMLGATILPIGDEPNGTRWTGFQCIIDDKTGYLAVYRERNRSTRHRFRLYKLESCRIELQPVLGTAQERRLEVDNRSEAWVTLPQPLSYAVYRYFRP